MKKKNLFLSILALLSCNVLADNTPPVEQVFVGSATEALFNLLAEAASKDGYFEYFGWEEKLEQCQGTESVSGKRILNTIIELADDLNVVSSHESAAKDGFAELTERLSDKMFSHSRTVVCENYGCIETDTYCANGRSLVLVVGFED